MVFVFFDKFGFVHKATVASVELFCKSEKSRENSDGVVGFFVESRGLQRFFGWQFFPVKTRDVSDNLDFSLVKSEELCVADYVVGVKLVVVEREKIAYVMQGCCVL